MVGFPHKHKRNLSTSKYVRFKGPDIIVPPLPSSQVPPTLPAAARIPADLSGIPDRSSLRHSSRTSDESTSFTSPDHTRLSSFFNHETPVADDLPDSPSMYSPTPPNSSTPSEVGLLESSTEWPNLADVNLPIIDIGHHQATVGESSDEELSDEQPTGEQPCGKDGLTPTLKEASCGGGDGHVSDRRHGNLTDAKFWWGRVSIVAGSVTLSLAKVWERNAHTTAAAKKSNGTKNVGNHAQEDVRNTGQS